MWAYAVFGNLILFVLLHLRKVLEQKCQLRRRPRPPVCAAKAMKLTMKVKLGLELDITVTKP
jgi:hypothetical protein